MRVPNFDLDPSAPHPCTQYRSQGAQLFIGIVVTITAGCGLFILLDLLSISTTGPIAKWGGFLVFLGGFVYTYWTAGSGGRGAGRRVSVTRDALIFTRRGGRLERRVDLPPKAVTQLRWEEIEPRSTFGLEVVTVGPALRLDLDDGDPIILAAVEVLGFGESRHRSAPVGDRPAYVLGAFSWLELLDVLDALGFPGLKEET